MKPKPETGERVKYERRWATWFAVVRENAELRWKGLPHKLWQTLRKEMPLY